MAGLPITLKGGGATVTRTHRRTPRPRRRALRADLADDRAARRRRDGGRRSASRPTHQAAGEPRPARDAGHPAGRDHRAAPTRRSARGRSSWPPPTTASRAAASRPIRPRSRPRWSPTSSPAARRSTSSPAAVGARVVVVDAGVAGPIPAVDARSAPRRHARQRPDPRRDRRHDRGTGDDPRRGARARSPPAGASSPTCAPTRSGSTSLGIGEMGIGNTTAASALAAVFTGRPGRGGDRPRDRASTTPAARRKIAVIETALARQSARPGRSDRRPRRGRRPRDRGPRRGHRRGGPGAASRSSSTASSAASAALVAVALEPRLGPRLIAGHRSTEPGHRIVLEHLGLVPILELDLRLGEASGAALAMAVIVAAVAIRDEMATFDSAGIAGPTMTARSSSSVTPRRRGPGERYSGRSDPPLTAAGRRVGRGAGRATRARPCRRASGSSRARAGGHTRRPPSLAARLAPVGPRDRRALARGRCRRRRGSDVRRGRRARYPALAAQLAAGEAEIDWPGGETAAALRDAGRRGLDRRSSPPDRPTVVVSHAGPIRIALGARDRPRRATTIAVPGARREAIAGARSDARSALGIGRAARSAAPRTPPRRAARSRRPSSGRRRWRA